MTELGANWLPKDFYRDNNSRKKFIITDLVISGTQWNHNTVISTLVSRVWQIEKIEKFLSLTSLGGRLYTRNSRLSRIYFASEDDYQTILPCNFIETKTYLIVTVGIGRCQWG